MKLIPVRLEAAEAGTMKLVGTSIKIILEKSTELLIDEIKYIKMANAINTYCDGLASSRLCKELKRTLIFLGS
jgi:UDP-N-acetylglucosamine 2-epimerase (non-hydrolysing)